MAGYTIYNKYKNSVQIMMTNKGFQ